MLYSRVCVWVFLVFCYEKKLKKNTTDFSWCLNMRSNSFLAVFVFFLFNITRCMITGGVLCLFFSLVRFLPNNSRQWREKFILKSSSYCYWKCNTFHLWNSYYATIKNFLFLSLCYKSLNGQFATFALVISHSMKAINASIVRW